MIATNDRHPLRSHSMHQNAAFRVVILFSYSVQPVGAKNVGGTFDIAFSNSASKYMHLTLSKSSLFKVHPTVLQSSFGEMIS